MINSGLHLNIHRNTTCMNTNTKQREFQYIIDLRPLLTSIRYLRVDIHLCWRYMIINSVILTSSAPPQVNDCGGLTIMCSPLHIHRGLYTEGQPSCTCSVLHTLFGTCKKPAQCRCWLPQVAWSSMVCIVLQSMTNPSWLVVGVLCWQQYLTPHMSTLIYCSLDMFL